MLLFWKNRITYYYRKKHENREDKRHITRIDSSIVNKVIELCRERVTYGYNRIWALLRNSGIRIARKTVYRIMKNNNLTLPLHIAAIVISGFWNDSIIILYFSSLEYTLPGI